MFKHLHTFIKSKESRSVGAAFLLMGLLFGTWATMIPFVKHKFSFSDAELGLILLGMPFGAVIFNPFSVYYIKKFGFRKMTHAGMLILSIVYLSPIISPVEWILVVALILTGMSITLLNVAMNTCASEIENHKKISIMSTQHGLFSVGLMLGSFAASTSIGIGTSPIIHTCFISVIGLVLFLWAKKGIFTVMEPRKETDISTQKIPFQWPKGDLLLMIVISLCVNITEGAMADWTAVYVNEIVHAPKTMIGYGFASYSMMMATGRLLGDGFIPKLGLNKVLFYGGVLVVVGLSIALSIPSIFTSMIGFGLVGMGVSCGAPILYGSASKMPDLASGQGLATMNTFAMFGFMGGPVLIGFISSASNLIVALSLIIFVAIIWTFLSKIVTLYK